MYKRWAKHKTDKYITIFHTNEAKWTLIQASQKSILHDPQSCFFFFASSCYWCSVELNCTKFTHTNIMKTFLAQLFKSFVPHLRTGVIIFAAALSILWKWDFKLQLLEFGTKQSIYTGVQVCSRWVALTVLNPFVVLEFKAMKQRTAKLPVCSMQGRMGELQAATASGYSARVRWAC